MREIKFRAWDSDNNTMWYMPELESDESPNELLSNFLDDYYDCVLLQFTGLKDKNGKEIYEGDIISYWNGTINEDNNGTIEYKNKKYSRTKNTIVEIVYEAPSFRIKDGNPLLSNCLDRKDIEIIGNIYENHELLEPKNGGKNND